MNQKTGTMNVVRTVGEQEVRVSRRVVAYTLLSIAVVLVALALIAALGVARTETPAGVLVGREASAARWSALGAYHSEREGRAADAMRWSALGAVYGPDYDAIAAVNGARWSALGVYYGPDYEVIAQTSAARKSWVRSRDTARRKTWTLLPAE